MYGTFSQTLLISVLSPVSSVQFTRSTFPDFSNVLMCFYDMHFIFCSFGIFCVFVCFFSLKGHHKSLSWAWCVLFRVHVFIFALYCICIFEQIGLNIWWWWWWWWWLAANAGYTTHLAVPTSTLRTKSPSVQCFTKFMCILLVWLFLFDCYHGLANRCFLFTIAKNNVWIFLEYPNVLHTG